MALLDKFVNTKGAAEAALDERALAEALTDGLAQKVAPALEPVLKAAIDGLPAKLREALEGLTVTITVGRKGAPNG